MRLFTYTFTHAGHEVVYRIMARNKHIANRYAKTQRLAWQAAIDAA